MSNLTTEKQTHLCVSIDLGSNVTVDSLQEQLRKLSNSGRGGHKIKIDVDQIGTALDLKSLQVSDADKIIELTHV